MDQTLIDRIVANVLEQLQPATPRALTTSAAVPAMKPTAVALSQAVITADVLSNAVRPGQAVQIGTKSLLTPSAKDWLRQHQVIWQRGSDQTAGNGVTSLTMRGQLLLSSITPTVRGAVDSVFRSLPNWQRQVCGNAKESAEAAVRTITTAECDRVLITSRDADVVACRVNRHRAVRAAVVASGEQVRRVDASLSPNVLVVDPDGRSFVELRNLFRSCAQLGKPQSKEI